MTDRQIHIRSCLLCEVMCGLEVHHADGEVKLIRPNRNDAWLKGHICTGVLGSPDGVRERGKVVVVAPRRSETCAHADQWLPVRPGTDALLQLAVVNVLFGEGLVRPGHLADRLKGTDEIRAIAAEFPPERVAEACGADAETIRPPDFVDVPSGNAAVNGVPVTVAPASGVQA